MRPLDLLAQRLEARDLIASRAGDKLTARCPAHDDRNASLSAGTGHDDRALVHCHAGCSTADVLDALELEVRDLFADGGGKPWTNAGMRRTGAIFERDGRARLGGTRYLPGAPQGTTKILAARGASRDLWPDPADVVGDTLFVVEGEPDAVTGAALELPTVAVPGAAKWRREWAARLAAGRGRVVVIADADEPGRRSAARIAAAVAKHCQDVRVLDLAPERTDGFDLSDYAAAALSANERRRAAELLLAAGATAERVPVPLAAPIGGGTVAPSTETRIQTGDSGVPPAGTAGTMAPPGTLRRCDVRRMLTTTPAPVEWIADGVVARGTLTLLAGREKEGKSLLAMAIAARAATGGGSLAGINVHPARTLVVDAENGDGELHRRVQGLGLTVDHAERVEVYEAAGHDLRRHLDELAGLLTEHQPDLLILDSWRSLWGGDENDSGEVARCLDPLRNLIRQHNAGAVLIHHMKKGGGYRGSSAIGASVENVLELARHDEDADRRRRRLRNPACRFEQEADDRWLRIEADRDHGLLLVDEADPFRSATGPREDATSSLLAVLNGHPTPWAQWARAAGLDPKNGTARRARDSLSEQGVIEQDAHGQWRHTEPCRSGTALAFPGTALDADDEAGA